MGTAAWALDGGTLTLGWARAPERGLATGTAGSYLRWAIAVGFSLVPALRQWRMEWGLGLGEGWPRWFCSAEKCGKPSDPDGRLRRAGPRGLGQDGFLMLGQAVFSYWAELSSKVFLIFFIFRNQLMAQINKFKIFCCGVIWMIMFKIQWHFGPILVSFVLVRFPFSILWRLEKLVIGRNWEIIKLKLRENLDN
jgi:hypothetical protein